MKNILILGASSNQLPLILEAKSQGYNVVDCDNTTTNPGLKFVDKHYHVNFMDRERVLEIAKKENISGVISNSEPAMLVVAYISETLGLVGNTVESVSHFMQKESFRNLQNNLSLYNPKHFSVSSKEEFYDKVKNIEFPIIIKPCQSSGSRGTTKIENLDSKEFVEETLLNCISFSRNKKATVEEYVCMNEPEILEGEIFVHNGRVIWNCMFYNRRSLYAPLVPMTDCGPVELTSKVEEVKKTLELLLKESGIIFGQFNPELYFTDKGEIFVVEINPRQGAASVNGFVESFSGINLNKLLVSTAMGDDSYFNYLLSNEPTTTKLIHHKVFSRYDGNFQGIYISEEIEKYVINYRELVRKGECVRKCNDATDILADVFLIFQNTADLYKYYKNIEDYIYPLIK